MAGSKPPYFPFYVRDFASDGKVEAMTTTEVGAYILLLCKAWLEEPPGSIPADDTVLARWARLDAVTWSKCRARVLSPFTLETSSNRYFQKRMQEEFRKLMCLYKSRSSGGRKGATKRWKKGDKKDDANNPSYSLPIGTPNGTPNGKSMAPVSDSICIQSLKDEYISSGLGGLGEGGENGIPNGIPIANPSTLPDTPPPRSALPADNPELAAVAQRVIQHYQDAVKPAQTKRGGPVAVIEQLQRGRTEEALKRAAIGFAAWCTANGREPRFRDSVRAFYGDGTYEQFLDYQPPPPGAEREERTQRQQRERQARTPTGPTVPLSDLLASLNQRNGHRNGDAIAAE